MSYTGLAALNSGDTLTHTRINAMDGNTREGWGVRGLRIVPNSGAPTTSVDVDCDDCPLYSSGGAAVVARDVNVTIDATSNGANGLDAGSLAAATWYYVFVIGKDADSDGEADSVAGLLSTSYSSPSLPSGYSYFKLVGARRTKAAAAEFLGLRQVNATATYNTAQVAATGTSAVSKTALDLSNFMPSISADSYMRGRLDTSGSADVALHIYVTGETDPIVNIEGEAGANVNSGVTPITANGQSVDHSVTVAASGFTYYFEVLGFEFPIDRRF